MSQSCNHLPGVVDGSWVGGDDTQIDDRDRLGPVRSANRRADNSNPNRSCHDTLPNTVTIPQQSTTVIRDLHLAESVQMCFPDTTSLPDPPEIANTNPRAPPLPRLHNDRYTPTVLWFQRYLKIGARRRVQAHDKDDVMQVAAVLLWRQCVRCVDPDVTPFQINGLRIAIAAWGEWVGVKRRRRPPNATDVSNDDEQNPMLDVPAVQTAIRVTEGGRTVTLTLDDARIDHRYEFEVWSTGLTVSETAKRLSVTRQAIHAIPLSYGGVEFDGRWLFPRDVTRPSRRKR